MVIPILKLKSLVNYQQSSIFLLVLKREILIYMFQEHLNFQPVQIMIMHHVVMDLILLPFQWRKILQENTGLECMDTVLTTSLH